MRIFKKVIETGDSHQCYFRGQVAASEKLRSFGQDGLFNGEQRKSHTRGEVASYEQMKIVRETISYYLTSKAREPKTRGKVVSQEQSKIFSKVFRNLSTYVKTKLI